MKLIFERSVNGRHCQILPSSDVPYVMPEHGRELPLRLPEVSENDISRHYTELAKATHGVNDGCYPLGSCTMKYNPKINEEIAGLPGFTGIHPLQPESTVQGALEVLKTAEEIFSEITGMDSMTFQPAAGAHGEFTGLLLIRAWHESRGDEKRTKIIVPDSAHGTNPATAAMCGYQVVNIPSAPNGCVDLEALKAVLGDDLAAQLVQAASASDDAAWIAAHPDAYAVDGEAVQRKLLKLAAVEPEAVAFVRTFPDAYPAESALGTDDPASGEVPRLYQWDQRWGSTVYSSTTFALTGCCPTSLSMVYQGLTGKGDLSPYDMGKRASDGGFETAFDGTDSSFLVSEAASLGLSCEALSVDAGSVRAALEGGAVLVCNVGPGDFTDNGHFFVVTGIDGDGNLRINDPYSAERSNRAWNVDTVLGQTKALWAYRLA